MPVSWSEKCEPGYSPHTQSQLPPGHRSLRTVSHEKRQELSPYIHLQAPEHLWMFYSLGWPLQDLAWEKGRREKKGCPSADPFRPTAASINRALTSLSPAPTPLLDRHHNDSDMHHTGQSKREKREGEESRQLRSVSKAYLEETKAKEKWASAFPSTLPTPIPTLSPTIYQHRDFKELRHQMDKNQGQKPSISGMLSLSPCCANHPRGMCPFPFPSSPDHPYWGPDVKHPTHPLAPGQGDVSHCRITKVGLETRGLTLCVKIHDGVSGVGVWS